MTGHQFLESVLEDYKFDEATEKPKVEANRDKVEAKIRAEFGSAIQTVKYSGSIAKATAIKSSHDIDIAIHFKSDSFETLEQMYQAVMDLLKKHWKTREQKVSIGLPGLDVDVVPGRRISTDTSNNDVWLYRTDTKTRIKTNIEKQKAAVTESGVRDVIKLAKAWREQWGLHFKSFAIELLVMRALEGFTGSGLDNKYRAVLEFIRDSVETCQLIDPGNSANNVADTVDSGDKKLFKAKAKECLGFLDELDEESSETDRENAWRKVFKYKTVSGDAKESYSSRIIVGTQDFRGQSDRRHG